MKTSQLVMIVAIALLLPHRAAHAELRRGDILVPDLFGGTNVRGVLLKIDPATGSQTVLSDFGNDSQGPLGQNPNNVTIAADGTIYVVDVDFGDNIFFGALLVVNPITGERTVVSDFDNRFQGPFGGNPTDVAVEPAGTVLVVDPHAGSGSDIDERGLGRLFRIDPANGNRSVLSEFGDPNQGPLGADPVAVIASASGDIYVIDSGTREFRGMLFKVDRITGNRTIISDFDNSAQGPLGENPLDLAFDIDGDILVIDMDARVTGGGTSKPAGLLFKVNRMTGVRTVLSDFNLDSQGPSGSFPAGVALGPGGTILVTDNGLLLSVNRATGVRTQLSAVGTATSDRVRIPHGVEMAPLTRAGDVLVTDAGAGTNGAGALFSVDPNTGGRTLVVNFGDALGGAGADPADVAFGVGGAMVIDSNAGTGANGALFKVSQTIGNRTLLSDFGASGQGALAVNPLGVANPNVFPFLVVDPDAGTNGSGALYRINRSTGSRILLSDFGSPAKGPVGASPQGVVRDLSSDTIWVIDSDAGTNFNGALFSIAPATGQRTLVSDFGNGAQGPTGVNPRGLTLGNDGSIFVIDPDAGTSGQGALFKVDPANGNRTRLNEFGNSSQGGIGINPRAVVQSTSGSIFVLDPDAGTLNRGALFRINPATRNRTIVSNFGNGNQGPVGVKLSGLSLVPTPSGAGYSGTWTKLTDHQLGPKKAPRFQIKGTIDVTNPGTRNAGESSIQFFLSDDRALDENDLLLSESSFRPLEAGETRAEKLNVQVNGAVAGKFVIAVLDVFNEVAEVNEENNVVISPPLP